MSELSLAVKLFVACSDNRIQQFGMHGNSLGAGRPGRAPIRVSEVAQMRVRTQTYTGGGRSAAKAAYAALLNAERSAECAQQADGEVPACFFAVMVIGLKFNVAPPRSNAVMPTL
jgi:hypothetical protein